MLTLVGGYNIFAAPFLTQFAIPCSVLSMLVSFPTANPQIFWAALYGCSEAMCFRMIEIGQ